MVGVRHAGFLVGNMSYDKDGVRTSAIFAEMASQLYARSVNLAQHLEELYQRYVLVLISNF